MPIPLNDSLNNPVQRWGLPVPAILVIFGLAGFLVWWKSVLLGMSVAIGLPALSKLFVSLDPQIYRLAALSLSQSALYDPRKAK